MGRRLVSRAISGIGKLRFTRDAAGRCKRGHYAERYESGHCKECSRERSAARAKREKEARAKRTPQQIEREKAKREEAKLKQLKAERREKHKAWEAEQKAKRAERKAELAQRRLSKEMLELLG